MRRPWLRPLILTLIAGTAGAVLQVCAAGGITEVSPSRIATLTVAILLGPWHGLGEPNPIVALTAHAMEGDRQRCLVRMDGYVSKPIDSSELFRVINALTRAA